MRWFNMGQVKNSVWPRREFCGAWAPVFREVWVADFAVFGFPRLKALKCNFRIFVTKCKPGTLSKVIAWGSGTWKIFLW